MSELTSLADWLVDHDDSVVSVDGGQTFTGVHLADRAADWYAELSAVNATRLAVYHHDALEFLAILLAIWQLGRVACVPGDNRPGTIERLKNHAVRFLGEFDTPASIAEPTHNTRNCSAVWQTANIDNPALEIYTSGSTGEPTPIVKSIRQLQRELETLEAQWPSVPGEVILGTVSHQHIYGMTFRLFWPLVSGRRFARQVCEYTEEIHSQGQLFPEFSLISSPSHLGRMNTALDWTALHGACRSITSSAAPLDRNDSLHVSRLLKCDVREIYGSSETGAIAWRRQLPESDALWRPLPGVALNATRDTDTLCVECSYLGDQRQIVLPDRVRFKHPGEFELLGRVDRIAKIEGKRVSLAAVENLLLQHRFVKSCKTVVLERSRVEIAVVLQLTGEGQTSLLEEGYKAMLAQLRELLSTNFERVMLPRRWRLVESMPFNSQGKLPVQNLKELFDKKEVEEPVVVSRKYDTDTASLCLFLPQNLVYFNGHFTDAPILPGVVQVHLAAKYAQSLLPVRGTFDRLEVIKFQQVIPARHTVSLTLHYDNDKQKLYFEYSSNRGMHSSGRICYT